jgi:hypothetical protein
MLIEHKIRSCRDVTCDCDVSTVHLPQNEQFQLSVTKMAGEYNLLINFLNQDYTEEDE